MPHDHPRRPGLRLTSSAGKQEARKQPANRSLNRVAPRDGAGRDERVQSKGAFTVIAPDPLRRQELHKQNKVSVANLDPA
jgi:hypothetical protein